MRGERPEDAPDSAEPRETVGSALTRQAETRFGELSPAETGLISALELAELGACGETSLTKADLERDDVPTVRADVLKWVLGQAGPGKPLGISPITIFGAAVREPLSFENDLIEVPLRLFGCAFAGGVEVMGLDCRDLVILGGYMRQFNSANMHVDGSLYVGGLSSEEFICDGAFSLVGADVSGIVLFEQCFLSGQREGETYPHPREDFDALSLSNCTIGGNVRFNVGVKTFGRVHLSGLHAAKEVIFDGVTAINPTTGRSAIDLSGVNVHGDLWLKGDTLVSGRVILDEARVEGSVRIEDVRLAATAHDEPIEQEYGEDIAVDWVLSARDLRATRFLCRDSVLHGWIWASGIDVDANLEVSACEFTGDVQPTLSRILSRLAPGGADATAPSLEDTPAEESVAGGEAVSVVHGLRADRARVGGELVWRNLEITPTTLLDLRYSSLRFLADDKESWPHPGMLMLNGLTYIGFSAGPYDASSRIDWLRRQPSEPYHPQPYRQLAGIYRADGDVDDARRIYLEQNHARLRSPSLPLWAKGLGRFEGMLTGFGYAPGRSLWLIVLLVILGAGIFNSANLAGAVKPVKPDTRIDQFDAVAYSVDVFVPVVDLGQNKQFQIVEMPGASRFRIYYWLHIALGWALSTLAVLGYSGVIRRT